MDHVKSLKCLICGREYSPSEIEYVCPLHGDEGIVDVQYDYGLIGERISPQSLAADPDRTIWRYRPAVAHRARQPGAAPHGGLDTAVSGRPPGSRAGPETRVGQG